MILKILFTLLLISLTAQADVWVKGYHRSDGTYVKGHYRSSPDSSVSNNWSTKGNTNPYTGKAGTRTYNGGNSSNYPVHSANQASSYKETKRQFGAIALVIGLPLLILLFLFNPAN